MNKQKIRKNVAAMRNSLKEEEFNELNTMLFDNFISNIPLPEETKYIFMYSSFKNEADTEKLTEYFLKKGYKTAFPKVTDRNNSKMSFFEVNDASELRAGYMGIKEPAGKFNVDTFVKNAVMIIPLVGFDESLNRVGYGGGYYDRYLSLNTPKLKIGLAFEFQKFRVGTRDEYDIKMDCIVTEKNVYGGNYE